MRAKILLSVIALGAIGLAAVPGEIFKKPTLGPAASVHDSGSSTTSNALADSAVKSPLALSAADARANEPQPTNLASLEAKTATPPEAAGGEQATVGGSALNVRQGPAASTAKLFVVQPGEKLAVLNRQGGWVQVRRPTGESGWVSSKYLANGTGAATDTQVPTATAVNNAPPATGDAATQSRRYIRLAAGSVLFSAPRPSSQPIFRVQAGERLRVSDSQGNWMRVTTADGLSGWLLVR